MVNKNNPSTIPFTDLPVDEEKLGTHIDSQIAPRRTFLDRVKDVGQSLRNIKPADVAFFATNIAAGVAAKAVAAGAVKLAVSTLGVTALSGTAGVIITGAAIAVAGGAAVGATRVLLSHAMGRSEMTSAEMKKKVLLGAAISGATFGLLSGGDAFLNHTEMGEKFAGKLAANFNAHAPGFIKEWFAKPAPANVVAPVKPDCEMIKDGGMVVGYKVNIGPDSPRFAKVDEDCLKEFSAARVSDHTAETKVPDSQSLSKGEHLLETPDKAEHKKTGTIKKLLKAFAPKVAAPVIADVAPQSTDAASEELKKLLGITSQEKMNEVYLRERLEKFITEVTGVKPAANTSLLDMAKQMSDKNPEAVLKALAQQAPQLDRDHLAATCNADIPKQFGQDNVIKTQCHQLKAQMGSQDIVIVRDVNEKADKGIRALYRGVVKAVAGRTEDVSTTGFLMEKVGGPGGMVQQMTEEAQASFNKAQLVPQ